MAGYFPPSTTLGKTKMDDSEQQFYQPSAKKTKVDYQDGSWQQPDSFSDYSSYYNMYTTQQSQPQQSTQQQQAQTQQVAASAYTQPMGSFDSTQYSGYGGYSSYYSQDVSSATPVATYECPLYDKSSGTGYFGNSSQQSGTYGSQQSTNFGSQSRQSDNNYGSQTQQSNNNFGSQTQQSNTNNFGSQSQQNNNNPGSQSQQSTTYGSNTSQGTSRYSSVGFGRNTDSSDRGRSQGYQNSQGGWGSGSNTRNNRGGTASRGNRGASNGNDRGASNMRGGRGGSNSRVGNQGFYDDISSGNNNRNRDTRGRGGSNTGGAGRGGVATGQAPRGAGTGGTSRGRGRGGKASQNGAGKWETLPGGQSRTSEKPLQTPKPEVVDVSKLPLPEKLRRLSVFLRNEKRDVNEIMLFENSLMSCKLGIRPNFLIDHMVQGKNGSFFTGRLILDGVFLARSIGSNKKHIKLACFKKAVEMCRAMTVTEIMDQKDLADEALKEKLENLNATVAKVEKETLEELPTIDILKKLQDILTNPKYTPTNAISNMELAASVSKCRIRCRYDGEQATSTSGKPFYKGLYYIDNVLQGFGVSMAKKASKNSCYSMVVQRLTTSKAEDILGGVSSEVVEKAIEDLNASIKVTVKNQRTFDLGSKFKKLKELLLLSDESLDVVPAMDLMFAEVKLTPICIYRQGTKEECGPARKLFCNLYLAARLMDIGEASNRNDAQMDAYKKTKELVLKTDSEAIITQHRKLQPQDQTAPDVIDFRVRGNCVLRNNCTNYQRLQRTKLKVSSTPVKDLVIYEHASWSTDRKVQGFCILQHSCFLNNMLLEWVFNDDDTKVFRCEMKVQKEEVMTQPVKSVSKLGSRNLAAADILFKMYETNPVIQITTYTKVEPNTKILSFEEIVNEAKELEKQAIEAGENTGEDVEMASTPADDEETKVKTEPAADESQPAADDGDEEMKEEGQDKDVNQKPKSRYQRRTNFRHADRFIIQVIKNKLTEFVEHKSLDDLLLGPSYPPQISRQINAVLRNLEVPVRFMIRPIKNEMFTIITQSMAPVEMAEFLKANGGSSGRFKLVSQPELPSHKDIEPELAIGEIKMMKPKTDSGSEKADNFFDDVSLESNSDFHTAMSSTLGDNSAYASTYDTTMTSANSSMTTPQKGVVDSSLPNTPLQGNTSTPKQETATPVRRTSARKTKK